MKFLKSVFRLGSIAFKNGVKDFLYGLSLRHIPVVILSAGIGNVIIETLKLNDCFYDNIHIVSNFINFKDNLMLPFNDDVIHTCNKSMNMLPSNIVSIVKNKDYILLFGDLVEDLNMVNKEDFSKTISFGFLDKNVEENFELYKSSFDIVLTDNSSFYDVLNIFDEY